MLTRSYWYVLFYKLHTNMLACCILWEEMCPLDWTTLTSNFSHALMMRWVTRDIDNNQNRHCNGFLIYIMSDHLERNESPHLQLHDNDLDRGVTQRAMTFHPRVIQNHEYS